MKKLNHNRAFILAKIRGNGKKIPGIVAMMNDECAKIFLSSYYPEEYKSIMGEENEDLHD